MNIILDTNFLIYCAKEKIHYIEDIFDLVNENHKLVVSEQVIEELKKLRDDKLRKVKGKDKEAASLALQIIEKNILEGNIEKVNAVGKTVDEAIINLAEQNKKNIVCTLDREMRHILGRVILLNKNKKLILTR